MDDENHIEIEVAVSGTEEAAQKVDALTASVAKAKQTTANPMAMPESMLGLPKPEVIDHTAEKIKILDGDVKALASSEQSVEAALKKVETASKDAGEAGVKAAQDTAAAAKKAAEAVEKQAKAAEAAADATEKAAEATEKQAKATENAADAAKKAAEATEKQAKATENQAKAEEGKSLKNIETSTKSIEMMQKALLASKAIAGVKAALEEMSAPGGPLAEYHKGVATAEAVTDGFGAALKILAATGNPYLALAAGAMSMLAATKKAYDDMQLQEDKTQAAVTRAFDQKFKLLKEERFHKENLALITQVGGIEAENEAMKKQEESLKRMISLRSELASEATKAARQEVELTKLKGGDVALAEANALATSMAGELQKLNDNLADAKLKTTDATRQEVLAAKALDLLEKDVTRGASENYNKEVEKAREYAKLTTEKGAEARELLKGAFAKYDASHTSIIRGAEIDLEKKETEYSGKISPAANKAFGEFFKTLQTELAKPQPQMVEAIAQITADSQKIVDATTAKTTEIGTQMDAAKTATVGAVEKISSNATQHAAAIDSSVSLASAQVKEALDLQTERILTALGKVAAACVENANRAKLADRRIDQLLARR